LQSKSFALDKQKVKFEDLGLLPYREVWDYQESLLQKNVQIKSAQLQSLREGKNWDLSTDTFHTLLFCEHPPVYTLGKSGNIDNVLMSEAALQEEGIDFYRTNRGGDITFHGPGQIVGYPIIDLEKFYTDISRYLRELEEVIILTLAEFGIIAGRSKGETGVWLDPDVAGKERKICAMGVRCSRWITMHGFALNVNTSLNYFGNIIPCGIVGKQVTSVQKELGMEVDIDAVKNILKQKFEMVFGFELY
jgi:lipoyl(octanoyl) transferase